MKLNLIVIRTSDPGLLKEQYAALGLNFEYHRHGKGPMHYSANVNNLIFEIYPLKQGQLKPDENLRLGFEVDSSSILIKDLNAAGWKTISEFETTDWGHVSVVQDLDGRKVELRIDQ